MEEFVARLAKVAEFIEGIVADKEALKEAEAKVAELEAAVAAKDAKERDELEAAIVALEGAVDRAKGEPAEEAPVDPEPAE